MGQRKAQRANTHESAEGGAGPPLGPEREEKALKHLISLLLIGVAVVLIGNSPATLDFIVPGALCIVAALIVGRRTA